MTISIHDGALVGYSVNFLENELLLDIETEADEIVTVTFENYLAHYFDHVTIYWNKSNRFLKKRLDLREKVHSFVFL
ncbi:hypothetical protein [Lysinibacillus sp. BPa_S21]|uniref:hypothetical protein n=1 Tax=Lysinibacillus sp. BPa_S21 TaxID=2932478 RepID=UPI002011DCBD|nr:hypothetical protein [Lysinibacillus sp. BPa_S21]MCL1696220.1 hypothetical protein [Lysinibacillus sp. BPa_S21]